MNEKRPWYSVREEVLGLAAFGVFIALGLALILLILCVGG